MCRLLNKKDLPEIFDLMEKMKVPIAGSSSQMIYSAICHDGLFNDGLVFVVAEEKNFLIGFSFAIIDWFHYWKIFLIRHPLIAVRIAGSRFMKMIRTIRHSNPHKNAEKDVINKYITSSCSKRSWKDSSPKIAKIGYTAVVKSYRKRGVGKGLEKYLLDVLAKRGVRRVDAWISKSNLPSIRLQHKLGYGIEKNAIGLFASIDID